MYLKTPITLALEGWIQSTTSGIYIWTILTWAQSNLDFYGVLRL